MSADLKRGDAVVYNGHLYYFQPNGSSCFLYEKLEDVGKKEKKVFSPSKAKVQRATLQQVQDSSRGQEAFVSGTPRKEEKNTPVRQTAPETPDDGQLSSAGRDDRESKPKTGAGQPRTLFPEVNNNGSGQIRLLNCQRLGNVSVHQDLRFLDGAVDCSLLTPAYESKVKKVAHDALAKSGWSGKRHANTTSQYAYELFFKDYPAGISHMDIAKDILRAYQREFRDYKPQGGRPDPQLWPQLIFELQLTISADREVVNFAFEIPMFEKE